jgi:hypothetical protein
MEKINCILFSKDRAMQVDATLQSFFIHCLDPENVKITIFYTCSNSQHSKQYTQLKQDWNNHPQVTFYEEKRFHKDFLDILNPFPKWSFNNLIYKLLLFADPRITKRLQNFIPKPRTDALVLFLVDDTIFTSEFLLKEINSALDANPDALGFSLRLGKNINHSYMLRRDEVQPVFNAAGNTFLKYKWIDGDMDFGYPLEVSSSVYRLVDVIASLISVPFNNPNYLEGGMNLNKTKFIASRPNLLCYSISKAFCNPINLVQTVSIQNRRAENVEYSTNELASLFDQGMRVNIDPFHHFVPNSCHMELKLVFNQLKGDS